LVLWLLDEKGADVNSRTSFGETPLHAALSLDVVNALLDRGADPTMRCEFNRTSLMDQVYGGNIDIVRRLLQDPRVRAFVDIQDHNSDTALHLACDNIEEDSASKVHLLLQAGANPNITNKYGSTPLDYLLQKYRSHQAPIILLEQSLADSKKAWLLVKACRLVVSSSSIATSSCMKDPATRGDPVPVAGGLNDENEGYCKLQSMVAFLVGVKGGPKGEGMPRDVFRIVMDLLMPSWDPLRRGVAILRV
jgi:hypothetical protein